MNGGVQLRNSAVPLAGGGTMFSVWAPHAETVSLRLRRAPVRPEAAREQWTAGGAGRRLALEPCGDVGRWSVVVPDAGAGDDYAYVLDGTRERADPASRWQPSGVHGPSRVVDPNTFRWTDTEWKGIERADLVFYELHVGTFTRAGTFDAVVEQLDRLRDLGVNAIELMPIAEFPGARNWGYDGVFPYAPQSTYGGPHGLARLIDALHARGFAAFLDVVLNHLGPEGNVLPEFGPYFTGRYRTPWGDALNYDGEHSDEVRAFFMDAALQWITDYHFDGLRLDAVHAIYDSSAQPFLSELTSAAHALGARLGRRVHVVAESDRNDPATVRGTERCGQGLDGVWSDDFHHSIHAVLTGERDGYYADFGRVADVAKAIEQRFVYDGRYSRFRRRRHGAPALDVGADRFVVCAQNHDQIGNRAGGERLSTLVSPARVRLAAALVLLSPYVPLLFMGEEYAEEAPFPYFVDHGEPDLLEAVRRGRREEFGAFGWAGELLDPASPATFESARIDPSLAGAGWHAGVLALHTELLSLRRNLPALRPAAAEVSTAHDEERRWVTAFYRTRESSVLAGFNFAAEACAVRAFGPSGTPRLVLSTDEARFGGGERFPSRGDANEPSLPGETARVWIVEDAGA